MTGTSRLFDADPRGRTDLKPGTVYAIAGEGGWIYYGQVMTDKWIAFFRRRDLRVASGPDILASPIMSKILVEYRSIGKALRSGAWKKLGRFDLHSDLLKPHVVVQWPVGTLTVTVWANGRPSHDARVEDPAIQQMEIVAAWDALDHIPQRLVADFGSEKAEWYVGGPIWRERQIKEERARRSPDQSWHRLPADWVSTSDR